MSILRQEEPKQQRPGQGRGKRHGKSDLRMSNEAVLAERMEEAAV